MTEPDDALDPAEDAMSVRQQLERAARDLWTMVEDAGDDYIVFMDRRRFSTRVSRRPNGLYGVSWEDEDGTWLEYEGEFENPRQGAFHAYQGPH